MQGYFIWLYSCIEATDTQDLLGMHEELLATHRNISLLYLLQQIAINKGILVLYCRKS